jgi:hypothetical protein
LLALTLIRVYLSIKNTAYHANSAERDRRGPRRYGD